MVGSLALYARVAELVYAGELDSPGLKVMQVRILSRVRFIVRGKWLTLAYAPVPQ